MTRTAQQVSRILAKAGHTRSTTHPTSVRGFTISSTGFRVQHGHGHRRGVLGPVEVHLILNSHKRNLTAEVVAGLWEDFKSEVTPTLESNGFVVTADDQYKVLVLAEADAS